MTSSKRPVKGEWPKERWGALWLCLDSDYPECVPDIIDGEGELAYLQSSPKVLLERYIPTSSVRELMEALRRSAETLHGLSDDPEHLRDVFTDCSNHNCVEARAALTRANELLGGDDD